jgi:hypothetical protein
LFLYSPKLILHGGAALRQSKFSPGYVRSAWQQFVGAASCRD